LVTAELPVVLPSHICSYALQRQRAVTQKMVSALYSEPAVLLVASTLLFRSLFKKDKLGLRAELDPLTL